MGNRPATALAPRPTTVSDSTTPPELHAYPADTRDSAWDGAPSPAVATRAPEYPTGRPVVDPGNRLPSNRGSRLAESFRIAPATYALLAVNIGVFLLMLASGVNWQMPSPLALLRFGANNAVLVLGGQWWRILTAMFVHVGILHLATNMWCLWNLGLLGEPLLGAMGITSVYLLTGAAGNLLSVAASVLAELLNGTRLGWLIHWTGANMGEVGAGASGAVFGIAGILIVLLSNRRLAESRNGHPGIPQEELDRLRRSVVLFAGINLLIGVGTIAVPIVRIDNMAHLGGILSGLALGLPLLPRMTSGRTRYLARQRVTFAGSAFLLLLFGVWISRLHG